MSKRLLALLLACAVLTAAVPVTAGAAEGASVYGSYTTARQGDWVWLYIYASEFENIAALDLQIYYDSGIFTPQDYQTWGLMDGGHVAVNTSQAGVITVSAAFLDGISGSGDLMGIAFSVSSDCEVGEYSFMIMAGDAYDTELNAVTVSSGKGTVEVQERSDSFNIYGWAQDYWNVPGDTVNCVLCVSDASPFVSADFVITYDPELMEFEGVELRDEMKTADAVYAVNANAAGTVRISYASSQPVSAWELLTVKLKAKQVCEDEIWVGLYASNVYREDLTRYGACESGLWFRVQEEEVITDRPDLYYSMETLMVGKQSTMTLYLQSGSGVAAGDFEIGYDPSVLRCANVEAGSGISDDAMLVINENYGEGSIRFSYINLNDTSETDIPLVTITWEPLCSPSDHCLITTNCKGVVDLEWNTVELDHWDSYHCVYEPFNVQEPTCTSWGWTELRCNACGGYWYYDTEPIDHSWDEGYVLQEPTEYSRGTRVYTCTVCGQERYEDIPLLNHTHSYETTVIEPTCTEQGFTIYSCFCGETYFDDYVDALGHDFGGWYVTREATCEENGEQQHDCIVCGAVETDVIPASGHELVWVDGQDATCMEPGWEGYEYCTKCSYSTYAELPATGHEFVWVDAQEPTCTQPGWEGYEYCTKCGESTYAELPAAGHDYAASVTAPTCTEQGYTTHTCAACGDSFVDGYVDSDDAALILKYDVGLIDEDGLDTAMGDVNGDGYVDSDDAALILKYDVGLIEGF